MSTEQAKNILSLRNLDTYSTAALLALQARLERGNQTVYDHFLCEYIGDPEPNSAHFRPLSRTSPIGRTLHYNNPFTIQRSYSRDGTLVNIRHAQSVLEVGEETSEYLVATADLKTGTVTEWKLAKPAEHFHGLGRSALRLTLIDPVASESPTVYRNGLVNAGRDPLTTLLLQRDKPMQSYARLTMDECVGMDFTPQLGDTQPLRSISELVSEVNELTLRYGIDLSLHNRPDRPQGLLA